MTTNEKRKSRTGSTGSKSSTKDSRVVPLVPPVDVLADEGLPTAGSPSHFLDERGQIIEYNDHFYHPGAPSIPPWQRPLRERRQQSKDPHTIQRVREASRFDHTHLAGVFEFIQHHCGEVVAKGNYLLSRDDIAVFCKDLGLSNELLLNRLFKIFSIGHEGWKNTVPVMDFMHVFSNILHGEYEAEFPKVCFLALDIEHTGVLDKKKLGALSRRNAKGLSELQIDAIHHAWEEHSEVIHTPGLMTLKEFKKCFAVSADLVRSFMGKLLETACSLYAAQDPSKPPPPEELDDSFDGVYDADSFLLSELEKMGGVTSPYAKGKKKKRKSKKKADKKK